MNVYETLFLVAFALIALRLSYLILRDERKNARAAAKEEFSPPGHRPVPTYSQPGWVEACHYDADGNFICGPSGEDEHGYLSR